MEKFDKKAYDKKYRKQHKSQFNVDLDKDVYEQLNKLLKQNGSTKSSWLNSAIREYFQNANELLFDRTANCDWCGEKKRVALCQYGTTLYNRLICKDCADATIEHHQMLDGSTPCWYRNE